MQQTFLKHRKLLKGSGNTGRSHGFVLAVLLLVYSLSCPQIWLTVIILVYFWLNIILLPVACSGPWYSSFHCLFLSMIFQFLYQEEQFIPLSPTLNKALHIVLNTQKNPTCMHRNKQTKTYKSLAIAVYLY